MDSENELNNHVKLATNSRVCPYIGLEDDRQTHYGFSHMANCCYRFKRPVPVRTDYQDTFCLTKDYSNCKIFPDDWKGNIPGEISTTHVNRRRLLMFRSTILLLSLILLGLLIFAVLDNYLIPVNVQWIFRASENGNSDVAFFQTVSNTPENKATPTITRDIIEILPHTNLEAHSPTPTPSKTATVTYTSTPTIRPASPTPGPDLETPFGPGGKYIVYIISAGQSPNRIASDYQTTVEVIRAINQLPDYASIQPDTILVIIPGEVDPNNVPQLRAIFLEEAITVFDLADKLNLSPEIILELNGIASQDILLPAGRWLVIPLGFN